MPSSVTILRGPVRSGKASSLVREYRAALSGFGVDRRALWLAPTGRAVRTVRELLLAEGMGACLNPGVVTFDQMCARVLTAAGARIEVVTPAMQRDLLRRIVERLVNEGALEHYAEAARRTSFIDMLVVHLGELKRRDIGPAEFLRAGGGARDAAAHRELARLYLDYEEALSTSGLADAEGRYRAARDALGDGHLSWPPPLELVVVDGFSDFTAVQLELLRRLAERARKVCISLPGDHPAARIARTDCVGTGRLTGHLSDQSKKVQHGPDASPRSDLFSKPNATLAALRRIFPSLEVKEFPPRPSDWPAMDHLAAHLFRNPNHVPARQERGSEQGAGGLERFEIIEAASEQDEIVQLARRIKRRLIGAAGSDCGLPIADGGLEGNSKSSLDRARPGDMVVVFRHLSDAAPRVREVFTEYGFPFALESGVPLVRAPVLRVLMALLRLDVEDFAFRRVVGVLTNNLLTTLAGGARAQAEWLVRELQVARGRDKLMEQVAELAEFGRAQLEADAQIDTAAHADRFERRWRAALVAHPLLGTLTSALDALPNKASLSEWITALEQLGGEFGLAPFSAPSVQHPSSIQEPASSIQMDAVAWQTIAENLLSLERLDERTGQAARQYTRRDLVALLTDLARHEKLPPPHDEVGRVRVLSATTARTVSAKHVYLAGMSEQAFPSPERAGRLYSERDYQYFASRIDGNAIGEAGDGIAGFMAEVPSRAEEEMLLFYEVATRATETLTISYPALDARAQLLPPSPYVTEIERTLGRDSAIRRSAPHLSPLPQDTKAYSSGEWRVGAVARALGGESLAPLAGLLADARAQALGNAIDAGLRTIQARSRRERFSPFEGLVESPAARARLAERFGTHHLWSPSQWELYAACPYRFFLETVLGLEPLGELVLQTDHARRGSLLHRVMAAFHRELAAALDADGARMQQGREQLSQRFVETLSRAVESVKASGVDAALVELDRRQIEKWGRRYFDELEKYNAHWTELAQPPAPAHFEVRFGPPRADEQDEDPRSTDAPFVLNLDGEEIRIVGRIDRIDVGQTGDRLVFNVIDYKSGRRPSLNADTMASGERLQPGLYVMAAEALLFGSAGATPMWAGYWSMKNGVVMKKQYSLVCSADGASATKEWDELRPKIEARVRQFVSDIRRGAFPVHSCDEHCTSRCDFNTVCRISQVRSLEKTWPEL